MKQKWRETASSGVCETDISKQDRGSVGPFRLCLEEDCFIIFIIIYFIIIVLLFFLVLFFTANALAKAISLANADGDERFSTKDGGKM